MLSPEAPTAKQVYLHVGAPKTGTTYVQQVLMENSQALARNSVLYPYENRGSSRRAMLGFRALDRGVDASREQRDAWKDVAERCRAWQGSTVIISHELLGAASPASIEAGIADLQPADVHVVFSARDLARQLVSDWQEHIKHKHTVTLEKFVDDLIEKGLDAPAPFGEMFWGLHDAANVLAKWAQFVPRENIHVLTVPQPGAPSDTLWRSFCKVTGLDPDAYDTEVRRSNTSMGVAETELVRRINADIRDLPSTSYDRLIRIQLAENILGRRSPKITLPPGRIEWVKQRSRRLIEELEQAGYQVEGDLEQLMPNEETHAIHFSPTELTEAELASAAMRAVTGLARHSGRQRQRILELEAALESRSAAPGALERAGVLHRLGRGRRSRTAASGGRSTGTASAPRPAGAY
jgi:hypothetical protein